MRELDTNYVLSAVRTIINQIVSTTSPFVIGSWGVSDYHPFKLVRKINGEDVQMAALIMKVNGLKFNGLVYVALDEGSDLYRIYGRQDGQLYGKQDDKLKEYYHDISFAELGDTLDTMIETGDMSTEEYRQEVNYQMKGC